MCVTNYMAWRTAVIEIYGVVGATVGGGVGVTAAAGCVDDVVLGTGASALGKAESASSARVAVSTSLAKSRPEATRRRQQSRASSMEIAEAGARASLGNFTLSLASSHLRSHARVVWLASPMVAAGSCKVCHAAAKSPCCFSSFARASA